MQVSMAKSQKKLATLWFIGAGILFLIVLFQTMLGRFGEQSGEAWGWLLPTIMPTLSLILSVLVVHAIGKSIERKTVDRFIFRLSFNLSAVYLVVVNLTILVSPFTSSSPIELMRQTHLWLGPFQGLVSASIGVFFVKKETA